MTTNKSCQKVLVFNFFGGVMRRGIPLYVDNLCIAFESVGVHCRQIRCPKIFRELPRPLLNLLFVILEQFLMPLLSVRFDRVIYPYNSVSLIGALSRRSALVVHDFIPNHERNARLSARYINTTQHVYKMLGRDVIYISRLGEMIGRRSRKFPAARTFFFPNSFYLFLQMRSTIMPIREQHVLLCSGWGANKDLSGALALYLNSGLYKSRPLHILGLAGRREVVDRYCDNHPELAGLITVLPKVEDREVVRAYETAAWVWVHSRKEGYGRSISEARFCACHVVATDIAPFREQKDNFTLLYSTLEEFERAVAASRPVLYECLCKLPEEHEILALEIKRFCIK